MTNSPDLIASTVKLPDGLVYTEPDSIGIEELRRLDEAANGPFSSPLHRADWPREDYIDKFIQVGVSNPDEDLLVGIGYLSIHDFSLERIDINRVNGSLHSLMVDRRYRHRGIGRAIVLERVRVADELGIRKLTTALSDTSTLKPLYDELGFQEEQTDQLTRRT